MDFNNTLFMMPLMVGVIFTIAAYIMLKFPPKKINSLYGYRTSSSMKNQKRWDFAQIYSSKLMLSFGLILILFSVLGLLISVNESRGVIISTIIIFSAVAILIYRTEKAIKQKFKND